VTWLFAASSVVSGVPKWESSRFLFAGTGFFFAAEVPLLMEGVMLGPGALESLLAVPPSTETIVGGLVNQREVVRRAIEGGTGGDADAAIGEKVQRYLCVVEWGKRREEMTALIGRKLYVLCAWNKT
jgi:hypothetical protein